MKRKFSAGKGDWHFPPFVLLFHNLSGKPLGYESSLSVRDVQLYLLLIHIASICVQLIPIKRLKGKTIYKRIIISLGNGIFSLHFENIKDMHSSLRFLDYTDLEIQVLIITGSVILDKFLRCFLTCKIAPSDFYIWQYMYSEKCNLKKKIFDSWAVRYFNYIHERGFKIQLDVAVLMNTLIFLLLLHLNVLQQQSQKKMLFLGVCSTEKSSFSFTFRQLFF